MSDPANWRAGDWVTSKIDRADIKAGNSYQIHDMPNDIDIVIKDDAGDFRNRLVSEFDLYFRP